MKYKIGDRVKIREDLTSGQYYGDNRLFFPEHMEISRGKECFVIRIDERNNWYSVKTGIDTFDREDFMFSNEMIEGLVFKVGDKVKLREGCEVGQRYGEPLVQEMIDVLSGEAKITDISSIRLIEINNRGFVFTKEMLQLVIPVEEIMCAIEPTISTNIPSIETGRTDGIPLFTDTTLRPTPEPTVEPVWTRFETPTNTTQEDIKVGSKILIPMIKTRSTDWNISYVIKRSIQNYKIGYVTVRKKYNANYISAENNSTIGGDYFNYSDVKLLNEGYTEGIIEPGRRIKTHNGQTKSFDWSFIGGADYIETEHYKQGFYADGMFIRVYKELVTKPRGTVQYTMYILLNNTEGKELIAYDEALIAKFNALHSQGSAQSVIRERQEEERRIVEEQARAQRLVREEQERLAREERQRVERERREAEQRELEEIDKHGIWWHHKEL